MKDLLDRAILLLLLERPRRKTDLVHDIYENPSELEFKKRYVNINYRLQLLMEEGLVTRNEHRIYQLNNLKYGYGILEIVFEDKHAETLEMGKILMKDLPDRGCTNVIFLEEIPTK